jgi:hypothetical protein
MVRVENNSYTTTTAFTLGRKTFNFTIRAREGSGKWKRREDKDGKRCTTRR